MRVALLSDIHGNLKALEAVLADLDDQGRFDHVVVAGDLAWAGPWPAEVVDRVRALGPAIQGNTDAFVGRSPDDPPEDKSDRHFWPLLIWTQERLGPERIQYLLDLPFSYRVPVESGHDLLVVHANPQDFHRPIAPQMDDADLSDLLGAEGEQDWEVLAFGHLHIPHTRRWHGRLLVDVASVGLPMDGDPRAAYAILTWDGSAWTVEHRRVSYPVPVVAHEMQSCGMPRGKHFAQRLLRASYDH